MLGLMDRRPNRVTRLGEGVFWVKCRRKAGRTFFGGGKGAGVGKKGKYGQVVTPGYR